MIFTCGKAKIKIIYYTLIVLLTIGKPTGSNGQQVYDLKKIWQAPNSIFRTDDQRDKIFTTADFHKYARLRDDEYGEYLKESWTDFRVMGGLPDESRTPSDQPPVFNSTGVDLSPPGKLGYSTIALPGDRKLIPRIRKPETGTFSTGKTSFLFYGQPVNISYDKLLAVTRIAFCAEDSIAYYWTSFARANSNHLVDQLMDYRDLLGLGDWGYFQLVKEASFQISSGDELNSDLLAWALMIRSGFDVRMAYNQTSTTILFPAANIICNKQFVVIGQQRFYADRVVKGALLLTCERPFPDTFGTIGLAFSTSLNFGGRLERHKVAYTWNHQVYEFTFRINPWVIRFYNDYPVTEMAVYFEAPLTAAFKEDVVKQLYPIISKMDETESIAFLQQFVQRAFSYAATNQNAPVIRFADECIYFKSGDDRSKAVLFSWLIRIVRQLPVLAVHYPEYYSLAVGLNEPVEGDFFWVNGKKYYFIDPTFINAPIGIVMPEFAGKRAHLIALRNPGLPAGRIQNVWQMASKLGAIRPGSGQDIVFDSRGRALITGYFSNNDSYVPFIACFSPWNSLQWIRKFEGSPRAIAFAVSLTNDNEIYIAGTFEGELNMEGQELQSSIGTDVFIAQFNQNGELAWMNQAGLDPAVQDGMMSSMVKFNRSGNNISVQYSNEDQRNLTHGFGADGEGGLYFIGAGIATPGDVPMSWTQVSTNVPQALGAEYNSLIKNKYPPKAAGSMALLNLLQLQGATITGTQIKAALNRQQPDSGTIYPSLMNVLDKVDKLVNQNGVVTLFIKGGTSIRLNNLVIGNGAGFNLQKFGNGDLSLGFFTGLRRLINQAGMPVNRILIDGSSGNLIVDFDFDHTLQTIPVEALFSHK